MAIGNALSHLLVNRLPIVYPDPSTYDLILPVPLHFKRLRRREFNQSLYLAKHVCNSLNLKLDTTSIRRVKDTRPQSMLGDKERRDNVKGAFCVARPEMILNKKVLIIDDVYTTGATINELAGLLLKHGASSVDALTLARAV